MKHKEMMKLIKTIFEKVKEIHTEGQKEYAMDEDNVFANFERVANALDTTKEKVLMVYLLKHIDGISAYANGLKSQREDVRGRITDTIVYLCLLWGMVENNK